MGVRMWRCGYVILFACVVYLCSFVVGWLVGWLVGCTIVPSLGCGSHLSFERACMHTCVPLHCAVLCGHVEMVQALLDWGAQRSQDAWRRFPRDVACLVISLGELVDFPYKL